MKKLLAFFSLFFLVLNQMYAQDQKMNAFINALMSKMTIDEKIGQLNLITPGSDIPTGSVVSTNEEKNCRRKCWGLS